MSHSPTAVGCWGTLAVIMGLMLVPCLGELCVLEPCSRNSSTSINQQDSESSDMAMVNPRISWLLFRLNSNKGDNRKTKPQKKPSKHGLPGPPGPPGPQGPPGPPAPQSGQQEDLMQELRLRLREVAVTAGTLDTSGGCLLCDQLPRVGTAFHCRLLQNLPVPRRSLVELQPFGAPPDEESQFQRGQGFNSSSGRYTAPVSGFYHLSGSLLIEPSENQRKTQPRQKDWIKASICIESLCHSNLSLEAMGGASQVGGVYSILLTGTLYLQAGEYVSIFIDNGTGSAFIVQKETLFSGILLGV
ncbi:erythroferrone [Brienomyrus brachyistius]|uniref:erythroferrone n=1 Tax=Brienomyrus brachyistius TaxID=42636 RepID=UPI0020B37EFD|nr:erythroferrone [Brienomyrus brachyistius]